MNRHRIEDALTVELRVGVAAAVLRVMETAGLTEKQRPAGDR